LMSLRTLSKVNIMGSNANVWKEKILHHVPPNYVPSKYGGADTSCPNIDFYLHQMSMNDDFNIRLRNNYPVADEALETVIVPAGGKFQKTVVVQSPGYLLRWGFKTDDHDIGFLFSNGRAKAIIDIRRVDSHKHMQLGTFVCPMAGSYVFCFDNSYSRMTSKVLRFGVFISEANNNNFDDKVLEC